MSRRLVARRGQRRRRTDREIRRLAMRLARLSGDNALAELVGLAILQMEAGRVFRSPRWQPTTAAEREAQARAPEVVQVEIGPDDPELSPRPTREELRAWTAQVGAERIIGFRRPGLSMERIDADDRRDTLSAEEVRELRVNKWHRVWRHLAGIPTPAMGWLGFEEGTRYVFLISDDRETRTRWKAVWTKLEANPRAILGCRATFALLSATHPRGFGMGIAEPGTPSKEWLRALDPWTGNDLRGKAPRRLRVEVRLQATGEVLWSATGPLSARDDLVSQAAREVSGRLPSRPKDRIEVHPEHLVSWLLTTGHGRLKAQTTGRIARALLGIARDASHDVVVSANKTVCDHFRAAKKLIARYQVKT